MSTGEKQYPVEKLISAWKMFSFDGLSHRTIEEKLNMPTGTSSYVIKNIRNMLVNGTKRKTHNYKLAIKQIKQLEKNRETPANLSGLHKEKEPIIVVLPESTDHYSTLESAMKNLQIAIEGVIAYEVEKRTLNEKKKIADLMEEAKESNWIHNLRRKFSGGQ